jgi:hypothetical protein
VHIAPSPTGVDPLSCSVHAPKHRRTEGLPRQITDNTAALKDFGPFQTIKVDLGIVVGPSFEFSYSNGTVIGSVTYGFGLGAAFTTMQTITGVRR